MEVFVGRDRELAQALTVLGELRDPRGAGADGGVVWDVVGINGIGKSTLLSRVREQAPSVSHLLDIPMDLSRRFAEIGMRGDCGPTASAAALASAFNRSCSLLLESADYLERHGRVRDAFADFRPACRDARERFEHFRAGRDLSADSDYAVRARITEFQAAVDEAFLQSWDQLGGQVVLLTVDPFDEFVDDEFGHWLLGMCRRLPHTLTLVGRVPADVPALVAQDGLDVEQRALPYFTEDEVGTFLRQRFVGLDLGETFTQFVEVLYAYTGGHPGGLELAAKLITELRVESDPVELRRVLDRLPEQESRKWAAMVHLIVAAVHDDLLRRAVDVVSVTRWFDDALLGHLLELGDGERRLAVDAIRTLRTFGLIQPMGGSGDGVFRLVGFIKASLAEDLRAGRTRWAQLHRRAADFYLDRLRDDESGLGDAVYDQWYRYETAAWQADKRQWLYHSSQLIDDRARTRAMFALVFLEAFYWYGCYVSFPFIDGLVEDWDRASRHSGDADDAQLTEDLKFLVEHYPLGPVKPADARWADLRGCLLRIQRVCKFEQAGDGGNVREAKALLKIFLAHTLRYADPARPKAAELYADALALVDAPEDAWLACWIVFEAADLACEAGRYADAAEHLQDAVRRTLELHDEPVDASGARPAGETSWDFELLADLHRLWADLRWAGGDRPAAAAGYGQAVECAYWFQGSPKPPDPYTARFYQEIVERVDERVAAVRADDPAGVDAFLDAVVRHGPPEGFESGGPFPVGPVPDDYGRTRSTFMDDWLWPWESRSDPGTALRALLAGP